MSDHFTKTTSQNYFQRLGSSLGGVVFGIILLLIGTILLFWNEGRAIDAQRGLNSGARSVVRLTTTSPIATNDGKLVHMTGQATAATPITDSQIGVTFPATIALVRKVEMYQWIQSASSTTKDKVGGTQETTTTYSYTKGWSDSPQDSTTFAQREGHTNPDMPFTTQKFQANDVKLGGFTLPGALMDQLTSETVTAPATIPEGWRNVNGALYKGSGNEAAPAIGDVRITYLPVASGTVLSVMGKQSRSTLEAWSSRNSNYELLVAQQGVASPDTMIKEQKAAESILTWVLRVLGSALNIGAISLLLGPLRAVGNVMPLVASIIGSGIGMVGFGVGSGLSLIVMAVAWFSFRPLLSIGLLAAAFALIFFLRGKSAPKPVEQAV